MAHKPEGAGYYGGYHGPISARLVLFYGVLIVVVAITGYLLYNYMSTPLVRFDQYGYPLEHAVPTTDYRETVQKEMRGLSALVELGLPTSVAREEAEATVVCAMRELYRRRPDIDIIVVRAYYDYNFGQTINQSLGYGVWGPGGRQAPVVHTKRKDDYAIRFYWRTDLPTMQERSVEELRRQQREEKQAASG